MIQTTEEATDLAIKRASEAQERRENGWAQVAYDYLVNYARLSPEFLIEEVRLSSVGIVPVAAKSGAWGAVTRAGIKNGIIKATGVYEKHKSISAHGDVKMRWASLIYKSKEL